MKSLNCAELEQIIQELNLTGGFVQKIFQIEIHTLVLHIYNRNELIALLLSTRQGFVRLHTTKVKKYPNVQKQRFAQLLDSKIKNCRIESIEQIHMERIIKITLSNKENRFFLYSIMWNNGANIILTDNNHRIIDGLYRRPGRNHTSGEKYIPETDFEGSTQDKKYVLRDYDEKKGFMVSIAETFDTAEKQEIFVREQKKFRKILEKEICRYRQRLINASNAVKKNPDPKMYKEWGDLLLSNIYLVQAHSESVTVDNYFNGEKTEIPLKMELSPTENAERYYSLSKKSMNARRFSNEEISSYENHILRLESAMDEAEKITTVSELSRLRTSLGFDTVQKANNNDEQSPGLIFTSNGFTILVGRNSRENDFLLRRKVRGNDIWLHTRDCPGGYVFIKVIKGKSVPLDVLLDAGNLALFFSKAKNSLKADLYYTHVKYLRRAKGAKLGTVLPFQDKNLEIKRDDERLKHLLKKPGL